jgi:UDP-hydrolysing UDP-N-acetyl-D-glucosamine 2-epimerase
MKVTVFSGGRADKGALSAVADELARREIEVNWQNIEPSISKDSVSHVAQSASMVTSDVAYYLDKIPSDLVILCGDRYETLGAALGAYLMKLPIAHLSGGDITEGSQDDGMRHALTKLSHLHFVTNKESARRVVQMGEEVWRVYNVGCPTLDGIKISSSPRKEPYALLVWHPTTLGDPAQETHELLRGLTEVNQPFVVLGPNPDSGHQDVRRLLKQWVSASPLRTYTEALSREDYLTYLAHAACLVGNSSSGVYEAPTFGTPVVNVGDRQQGRLFAQNVLSVNIDAQAIAIGVNAVFDTGRPLKKVKNPYGDGKAAKRIVDILLKVPSREKLLRKRWKDVDIGMGFNRLNPKALERGEK